MILPENATSRSLVFSPEWEIEDFPGCCKVDLIVRLSANYCTKKDKLAQQKQFIADKFAVDGIPEYDLRRKIKRESAFPAFAISRDAMFALVLQDMLENRSHLFIATDTISQQPRGDIHKGPFSTRRFVRWLSYNKLGHSKQGLSRRGSSNTLSCWSLLLKKDACLAYVEKSLIQSTNEYNTFARQCTNDVQASRRPGAPVLW